MKLKWMMNKCKTKAILVMMKPTIWNKMTWKFNKKSKNKAILYIFIIFYIKIII